MESRKSFEKKIGNREPSREIKSKKNCTNKFKKFQKKKFYIKKEKNEKKEMPVAGRPRCPVVPPRRRESARPRERGGGRTQGGRIRAAAAPGKHPP